MGRDGGGCAPNYPFTVVTGGSAACLHGGMKLATLHLTASRTCAAIVREDGAYDPLPGFADVGAWMAATPQEHDAALAESAEVGAERRIAAADVASGAFPLVQPVLRPAKVICVGLNYRNHIEETGNKVPEYPTLFTKYALSLTGPTADIEVPAEDHRMDWEGELTVVVGSGGRRLRGEEAAAAIGGYAIANDISLRGYQGRTTQWSAGKAWEASTPVGPWVVTPDEFVPGARIETLVNGEVVQSDSTGDLVFDAVALVEYLSDIITLEPGDLILTGTPGGVALGRKDENGRHPWLKPGDELVTRIEGLGEQRNRIV